MYKRRTTKQPIKEHLTKREQREQRANPEKITDSKKKNTQAHKIKTFKKVMLLNCRHSQTTKKTKPRKRKTKEEPRANQEKKQQRTQSQQQEEPREKQHLTTMTQRESHTLQRFKSGREQATTQKDTTKICRILSKI